MVKKKGIVTEGSEMEALVDEVGGATIASPLDRLAGYTGRQYRRGQVFFLLGLFLFVGVLLLRYEEIGEWFSNHEEDVEAKDDPDQEEKKSHWGLPDWNMPSVSDVTDWFNWGGGDDDGDGSQVKEARTSLPELLESLSRARKVIDELLKEDYGEYASVFNRSNTMGGAIGWNTDLSLERLKRRMKRKVIESQLRGTLGGVGDEEDPVTYTWATGGHSASAAHGNLLEQSYTAQLEMAAKIAFNAVDVSLRTKHFAMGSTSSPEQSLCLDEAYGKDIDALLWDFGMTDGRRPLWYKLWTDQAGLHPSFPILFAHDDGKITLHAECEKRGQGGFSFGRALPRAKFPDSSTHPDPGSLPRGVAYFMCDGKQESGDLCQPYKFDTKWCDCRGKVSWHPGWKDHLFVGRFLAMFLIENLVDAVKEMHERDSSPPPTNNSDAVSGSSAPSLSREYLDQLIAEEERDRQLFSSSNSISSDEKGTEDVGAGNWKKILRSNPICRSMRLPNQARFDGIMDGVVATNTGPSGFHTGINEHFTWNTLPKGGPPIANDMLKSAIDGLRPPWMVATDQEMRRPWMKSNRGELCNITVSHDFRDGFVVRHEDDWMGDVYPLDAEVELFSRGKYEREGFIVICNTICLFSNCNPGGPKWSVADVGLPERNGNISIHIDGQPVSRSMPLFADCFLLVGEGGNLNWGPGTKNGRKGQFEIKFKVSKPGKMIFSSVVVL